MFYPLRPDAHSPWRLLDTNENMGDIQAPKIAQYHHCPADGVWGLTAGLVVPWLAILRTLTPPTCNLGDGTEDSEYGQADRTV